MMEGKVVRSGFSSPSQSGYSNCEREEKYKYSGSIVEGLAASNKLSWKEQESRQAGRQSVDIFEEINRRGGEHIIITEKIL